MNDKVRGLGATAPRRHNAGVGVMADWEPISTAPDGVEVETRINDGLGIRNQQSLVRKGRLWFFPDMSMYVYYAPTEWRPTPEQP